MYNLLVKARCGSASLTSLSLPLSALCSSSLLILDEFPPHDSRLCSSLFLGFTCNHTESLKLFHIQVHSQALRCIKECDAQKPCFCRAYVVIIFHSGLFVTFCKFFSLHPWDFFPQSCTQM